MLYFNKIIYVFTIIYIDLCIVIFTRKDRYTIQICNFDKVCMINLRKLYVVEGRPEAQSDRE